MVTQIIRHEEIYMGSCNLNFVIVLLQPPTKRPDLKFKLVFLRPPALSDGFCLVYSLYIVPLICIGSSRFRKACRDLQRDSHDVCDSGNGICINHSFPRSR